MQFPPQVHEVVTTYLRLVEDAVPDLVEGLYLHGSVALGDFRPGGSDIDFLVLVPESPGDDELAALADIHRELARLDPTSPADRTVVQMSPAAMRPCSSRGAGSV